MFVIYTYVDYNESQAMKVTSWTDFCYFLPKIPNLRCFLSSFPSFIKGAKCDGGHLYTSLYFPTLTFQTVYKTSKALPRVALLPSPTFHLKSLCNLFLYRTYILTFICKYETQAFFFCVFNCCVYL